jgi:DNA-binding transcriptional MerR regulator
VNRLKINEVEALVGITKKNIRFYEAEGLLAPRRNSENGYRDYGEAEVETLRQIKLLRKLGMPLEEIRQMQSGVLTVGDGMRRHLVSLERDRANLEEAARLCAELQDSRERLETLDAAALLCRMDRMEQEGTTFMNKQKNDTKRRRYIAPIIVTALMAFLMAGCIWLFLWAFSTDPAGAPPLPLLALLVAIPGVVILGVVIALGLRIHEIGKGEEDDARKY